MKYLMLHPHPHPHIWNLTCTRPRQCQVLNNYIKVSRKCSLAPTWKRNCNPPIHEWTTYDQEVDAYTKQYTMSNPNLDQTHRMDKLIYIQLDPSKAKRSSIFKLLSNHRAQVMAQVTCWTQHLRVAECQWPLEKRPTMVHMCVCHVCVCVLNIDRWIQRALYLRVKPKMQRHERVLKKQDIFACNASDGPQNLKPKP